MQPKSPKRKGLPKKEKVKSSSLFEFLDDITVNKINILNSKNSSKYSKYMITKFLSLHEPYIPLVDCYLNKLHGSLTNEEFHKLCIAIFPQKKIYFNFSKTKPDINSCKDQLKYISEYFNISYNDAYEYYLISGDSIVTDIKRLYGII
jgi:hypothetical protein